MEVAADPYGRNRPSPIPNPTQNPPGEPIPAPGRPSRYPVYLKPIPVNTRNIEAIMRRHLRTQEPKLKRWLYSTWNANREDIKYQELRNALRDQEIPQGWVQAWRQAYIDVVNEHIAPRWEKTMAHSAKALIADAATLGVTLPPFVKSGARIEEWIRVRAGELIVALSDAQHQAVRSVLHYHTITDPLGPRELGRVLRPMVGLTPGQAEAVRKYRLTLIEEGAPRKQVEHLVGNYAGRLHRIRAERIARTELAFAFNKGLHEEIQQAQDVGDLPERMQKRWVTAVGDRSCKHCDALDDEAVGMDETFPGATKRIPNTFTPPAHPNCRCTLIYEMVG